MRSHCTDGPPATELGPWQPAVTGSDRLAGRAVGIDHVAADDGVLPFLVAHNELGAVGAQVHLVREYLADKLGFEVQWNGKPG